MADKSLALVFDNPKVTYWVSNEDSHRSAPYCLGQITHLHNYTQSRHHILIGMNINGNIFRESQPRNGRYSELCLRKY